MGDERTPLRLDQSYVKAKGGLGVPNPSQELELLDRVTQPTAVIDDVSHLAPVQFVPRYVARFQDPAPVNVASYQILPSPHPYLIETIDVIANNVEFQSSSTSLFAAGVDTSKTWEPTPGVAPRTLQFRYLDQAVTFQGAVFEQNRTQVVNMMVEPGQYTWIQAQVAAQGIDFLIVVQEFPGGIAQSDF